MLRRAAVFVLIMLLAGAALAVQPDEILEDPVLETRARDLSAELRCLVCQNQSIDDSNAPLARDLRILVRDRLQAGDSDEEVIDFVVARYGEFVLLRPRIGLETLLLWLAPLLLLVLGSVAIASALSRRQASAKPEPLNEDEERALAEALDARD